MKYLLLISIMIISFNAHSQSVDYNKIILPQSAGKNIDFEEKLVQLAWKNNPENNIYKKQVDMATYDLKLSKVQWLNFIQLQGNINEFNIDPSADIYNRAAFYPRYNLGARISLEDLFSIPLSNKKKYAAIDVAKDELNAQKLKIRDEVLEQYNNYLMYKQIYSIKSLALEDAESTHQLSEEAFKRGEVSFDKYTSELKNYNQIKIDEITSENDYLNAKLALEALIGVRLEDVDNQ